MNRTTNTNMVLLEMPHLFSKCPYCKQKFYFDAQIENWAVDKIVKQKLFNDYLKYHQLMLPCPYCKKNIIVNSKIKKTFKYDDIINKVKPDLANFFKKSNVYIEPFVSMNAVQPEYGESKEDHLTFEKFSFILDESEKENMKSNQRIVSFDFDSTIAKHPVDEQGDIDYNDIIPNEYIINKINEHISLGDKVILVTTRLNEWMWEVKNFIKKYEIPIKEENIYNTDGHWKVKMLNRMDVALHYDDNPDEIRLLKSYIKYHQNNGTRGILVK
jgi:hypothetical protein